jgi:divalent metal cation (Fe/Co/Zn/Cd) transporter
VIIGLRGHSLSVLAVGLGVLADVTGSSVLIWRFRGDRRQPGLAPDREARAALIVATALVVVAVVLITESAAALAAGTRPGSSPATIIAAAISLAVLTPLAIAKVRVARQIGSRALRGDGVLSGIGAATSLLALTALGLYNALGWWWADRVAALIVAVIAAVEAWHTSPWHRPRRA